MMNDRNLQIVNRTNHSPRLTQNSTIMDYAYRYFHQMKNFKDILYHINRVRIDKGLFLPFELVTADRMQTTNAFHNNRERSAVKWKFINN